MTKSAWGLLLALVASNAAWIATSPDDVTAPRAPTAPSRAPALRAELARLETKLEAVKKATTHTRPSRRHRPSATLESRAKAWARARPWIDDLRQIDDPARHVATLDAIREALRGDDPIAVEAGLVALSSTSDVHYDHASFRPLVLPHLTATGAGIRLAALSGLIYTKALPGDVARVLPLADDPVADVRAAVSRVLAVITKGDLTGAPGQAVLKLLRDADADVVHETLGGIGSARKLPPAAIDRLLELADDKATRESVLHFALMNMPKPRRVIDALLRYLDEGGLVQQVGVCLQRGIPPEEKDYVCRAILARLPDSQSYEQGEYLTILNSNADARHKDALKRLIDEKVILPASVRQANEILRRLR